MDLVHVTTNEEHSRGFMHRVTIYESEHSEIQRNMTFDISMMCRYMSWYDDIYRCNDIVDMFKF